MKYRSKQGEIVDAFRWTGGPDQTEDPEWIVAAIRSGHVTFTHASRIASVDAMAYVPGSKFNGTLGAVNMHVSYKSGWMTAVTGDYIVRHADGTITPTSRSAFEDEYERDADNGVLR
jgi:hypothetical protein